MPQSSGKPYTTILCYWFQTSFRRTNLSCIFPEFPLISRLRAPAKSLLPLLVQLPLFIMPRPLSLLPIVVLSFLSLSSAELGTKINIHVPLSSSASSSVTSSNQFLTSLLPVSSQQDQIIDFVTLYEPHCTLYLSTFRNASIEDGTLERLAASAVESASSACRSSGGGSSSSDDDDASVMTIGENLTLSGAYAMLSVPPTSCLQSLSDALVLALSPYVTETAKKSIPSWVYDLPPDEQAAKIALVNMYGSPNVFSGFSPHVTLAYDDVQNDAQDYASAVQTTAQQLWTKEGVESEVESVAFGYVGPAGTVVRGPSVFESVPLEDGDEESGLVLATTKKTTTQEEDEEITQEDHRNQPR